MTLKNSSLFYRYERGRFLICAIVLETFDTPWKGEKCVYYEVGNSMGIIVDTGSNDICWSGRSKPSFIL